MPTLSEAHLRGLLDPYLTTGWGNSAPPESLYSQLSVYLDLLLRWNARTNLTAVRDPEEIVRRHFGESLFAGTILLQELGTHETVLDLGSGAGFPGLPIHLLSPGLSMTLAESQGKKVAFLREAVRTLGLQTEVWSGRVEAMPQHRKFGAVTMRAVDRMARMEASARERLTQDGILLRLTGEQRESRRQWLVPGSRASFVELSRPLQLLFHVEQ